MSLTEIMKINEAPKNIQNSFKSFIESEDLGYYVQVDGKEYLISNKNIICLPEKGGDIEKISLIDQNKLDLALYLNNFFCNKKEQDRQVTSISNGTLKKEDRIEYLSVINLATTNIENFLRELPSLPNHYKK